MSAVVISGGRVIGTGGAVLSVPTQTPPTGTSFPLVMGRDLTNVPNFFTSAWQQRKASYDYVAMAAYSTAESGGTDTYAAAMAGIKSYASSLYSGHTVITGPEQIDQEWWQTGFGTDPVKQSAMVNNLGWRLQASGYPSGGVVTGDADFWVTNTCTSSQCPAYNIGSVGSITGPGSVNWSQWCAWYTQQEYVNGNSVAMGDSSTVAANPYVGLIDRDNQFMVPRSSGNWFSTSTVYTGAGSAGNTANTVGPYLQRGYRDAAVMTRSLLPGVLVVGNCDFFTYYNNGLNPQILDPAWANLYDISYMEAPVGQSYSYGTYCGSFANFLAGLISQEQLIKSTGYTAFLMEGSGNGTYGDFDVAQSGFTNAQWQAAEYQIGIAHLLRCITAIQVGANGYAYWFDAWDAGVGQLHWKGAPVGARPLNSSGVYQPPNSTAAAAWSTYGIITNIFENSIDYIYPAASNDSTSGLSAVTLSSSYLQNGGGYHIHYNGYSNSATNTGAAFNSLTLQPRSCVTTSLTNL